MNRPVAYLITFHTYGTWLHGNVQGSVDRRHKQFGEATVRPSMARQKAAQLRTKQQPLLLDGSQRTVVEQTIREVCARRWWSISALHVRTNHVHLVVSADKMPERVLGDLKAWSTRRLREAALISPDSLVWSHHGSTRYLWDEPSAVAAIDYVVNQQGNPLE
jgi:REP element-mobilizing transposase RayT